MSTNTQPRQPQGTPIGGQFAGKANPESDVELIATPDFGEPYGCVPAYILPDGRAATMYRKGQRVRFYDTSGEQIGPEQKNVAPAAAMALSYGWSPTPFGEESDMPQDGPQDRDARMAASSAAGELVFEGELLSNAYELWRHEPSIDRNRIFHHPSEVYVGGHQARWDSLSADQQLAYVRGYAKAITNGGDQAHRPRVHWTDPEGDGYVRGANVVSAVSVIRDHPGEDRGFRIVDPDAVGRVLVVTHVTPTEQRGGFTAKVAAGQKRRHHTDTTSQDVPWAEGSKVFFTEDALGI